MYLITKSLIADFLRGSSEQPSLLPGLQQYSLVRGPGSTGQSPQLQLLQVITKSQLLQVTTKLSSYKWQQNLSCYKWQQNLSCYKWQQNLSCFMWQQNLSCYKWQQNLSCFKWQQTSMTTNPSCYTYNWQQTLMTTNFNDNKLHKCQLLHVQVTTQSQLLQVTRNLNDNKSQPLHIQLTNRPQWQQN